MKILFVSKNVDHSDNLFQNKEIFSQNSEPGTCCFKSCFNFPVDFI